MEVSETCRLSITENLDTFNEQEKETIAESARILQQAHAPYSHFKVGAAILYEDGEIVSGNNQENPAYPSGLCAERVTLFHAMAQNPGRRITTLAISTRDVDHQSHPFAPPCGACLQVIDDVEHRQGHAIKIILCGAKEYYVADGVKQFLPFRFKF